MLVTKLSKSSTKNLSDIDSVELPFFSILPQSCATTVQTGLPVDSCCPFSRNTPPHQHEKNHFVEARLSSKVVIPPDSLNTNSTVILHQLFLDFQVWKHMKRLDSLSFQAKIKVRTFREEEANPNCEADHPLANMKGSDLNPNPNPKQSSLEDPTTRVVNSQRATFANVWLPQKVE